MSGRLLGPPGAPPGASLGPDTGVPVPRPGDVRARGALSGSFCDRFDDFRAIIFGYFVIIWVTFAIISGCPCLVPFLGVGVTFLSSFSLCFWCHVSDILHHVSQKVIFARYCVF